MREASYQIGLIEQIDTDVSRLQEVHKLTIVVVVGYLKAVSYLNNSRNSFSGHSLSWIFLNGLLTCYLRLQLSKYSCFNVVPRYRPRMFISYKLARCTPFPNEHSRCWGASKILTVWSWIRFRISVFSLLMNCSLWLLIKIDLSIHYLSWRWKYKKQRGDIPSAGQLKEALVLACLPCRFTVRVSRRTTKSSNSMGDGEDIYLTRQVTIRLERALYWLIFRCLPQIIV